MNVEKTTTNQADHREGAFVSTPGNDAMNKPIFADGVDWQLARFKLERQEGRLYELQGTEMLRYLAVLTRENLILYIRSNEITFLRRVFGLDAVLWFRKGTWLYDTPDFPVYRAWLALPTAADLIGLLAEEDAP